MAGCRVTQGALAGVPISGLDWPGLTGQVTSGPYRATGAARSEPHGHPGTTGRTACTSWLVRVLGAGCRVVYPGCRAMVGAGYAHHTYEDECIYGLLLGQGRAGAGPGQWLEQCQNSARIVP